MDELINLGLTHLSIDYNLILDKINIPNPTLMHHAAFSWVMHNPNRKEQCDEFLSVNTGYLETYLAFPALYTLSPELQYSKLGNLMPAYSLFVFPSELNCKYRVKHCKLSGLKIDEKILSILASELPYLFESIKNSNNKELVKAYISNWLQPLFNNINKIDIDHTVLEKITRYIDPLNIHHNIETMGCVWRAKDKHIFYLCYILGYPIHIMEHGPDNSIDILLHQLESVQRDRSIVLKRVRCIAIKHTLECATDNINLSMSSISDSRIEGLEMDYNNVVLNDSDSITRDHITTYSPFDIVRYTTPSGKIAQITRKEYSYVIETGCNPWTMEKVPESTLFQISDRNKLVLKHFLPECQPMNIILDYIFPRGAFDNL